MTLVLIHSQLVGPLTWQPCAEALSARGHRVLVPSLTGILSSAVPSHYAALTRRVAEQLPAADSKTHLILVGHSGAGSVLPSIAEALEADVRGAIFVDAILPHEGVSFFDTAPAPVRDQLHSLARDGRVPPWNRWFPPSILEGLLPDPALRARFVSELFEIPLAYFEERAPECPRWQSVRCGYLRLSAPYDEAANEAGRRGWPTLRLDADHLAMLTRPAEIATAIEEVVSALSGLAR